MRRHHPDVTPLEQLPLYRGVRTRALEVLAAHTDVVRVPAGRVVARAGRPATEYLALLDGDVVVTDAAGHLLAAPPGVGAGFGASELVHDELHAATVITCTASTFVVIAAPAFRASVRELPEVAARCAEAAAS